MTAPSDAAEAEMVVGFLDRHAGASDVLAPARGIVIGLALSAVLWALITMLATHL